MSRTAPIKVEQLSSDVKRLFDVLNNETDLPCVLIGVSFLDETVRALLNAFFKKGNTSDKLLSPLGGAIGEFSTRCDLGYCLGLVKKCHFQDLRKLAEVRNVFAHHHLGASFSDSEVQKKCRELTTPDLLSAFGGELSKPTEQYRLEQRAQDARNRFTVSIAMLSNYLLVEALGTKSERKSAQERD